MVLSSPQGIEAEFIHEHGDLFSHAKLSMSRSFVASHVRRSAIPPHIFQLNLPNIENREMLDHAACSSPSAAHGSLPRQFGAGDMVVMDHIIL